MNNADMQRMREHGLFTSGERERVPESMPDGFADLGAVHEAALAAFYQRVGMTAENSAIVAQKMVESLRTGRVKLFAHAEAGEITGLAGFQRGEEKNADLRIVVLHEDALESLRVTSGLIALAEAEARSRGLAILTAPDVPLASRNQMFLSNRGYLPDDEFKHPLPRRRTWRLPLDGQNAFIDRLATLQQPGKALDVGAGLGEQAIALSDASYVVIAMDKDPHSLAALNGANDALGKPFEVVEGNIATFEPRDKYDLVNMRHILHFLEPDEVPTVMMRMQDCTADGGIHHITVWSDRNPPHNLRPHPFAEAELAKYYAGWQVLKYTHLRIVEDGQWVIELMTRKPS